MPFTSRMNDFQSIAEWCHADSARKLDYRCTSVLFVDPGIQVDET